MMKINEGLKIVKKIESLGYEAYIIGGAVRDYLLGLDINDCDITTNMPLNLIFKHFPIIDNGSDYQSITIDINDGYEITHFRKDLEYIDHRHPIVVEVNTLKEDVSRRDFTCNAIAMNSNKDIIDYYNGIDDIKMKIIRCINDPLTRFEEDALRILRALHFSSKLNFSIEANTLNAMISKKHLLKCLSNQRLYEYLIKIVYSKYSNGIDYINKYDLFSEIEEYKNWILCVNNTYQENDLGIYYFLKYNKYPPYMTNEAKSLMLAAKELINSDFSLISIYKNQKNIYKLKDVFINLGYNINDIIYKLENLKIKSNNELSLSTSDISTMFSGKMISIVINEIIKAILDERISNTKEAILAFIEGLEVVRC